MRRLAIVSLLLSPHVASAGVVINEFLPDNGGSDFGFEWFELHNDGADPVLLTDWTFERAVTSWSTRFTFPETEIGPGDYLVVGGEFVAFADLNLVGSTLSMGNASSSGDAVRLLDDAGAVVDTVIYGPDNSDGFAEDDGTVPDVVGPSPEEDASLARLPDGVDTDSSAADFVLAEVPTPGAPNTAPAPECTVAADAIGLVINELLPDPVGADTGAEWVELVNLSGVEVDLSGWTLWGGTSGFTNFSTMPDGTTLASGAYLLVGQSPTLPDIDVFAPGFILGNASANADAVKLADCADTTVDTVIYGSPNDDEWLDDTGAVATSTGPAPESGKALGRISDGADTDQSADDIQLYDLPTPGEPNNGLVLEQTDPFVRGELVTLEVSGAEPGTVITLLRGSGAGAGPCPPVLGGGCLGLVNPFILGSELADDFGRAELSFTLPPSVPLVDIATQALQLDGPDTRFSNVNTTTIQP